MDTRFTPISSNFSDRSYHSSTKLGMNPLWIGPDRPCFLMVCLSASRRFLGKRPAITCRAKLAAILGKIVSLAAVMISF